jgi:hypothetical protein
LLLASNRGGAFGRVKGWAIGIEGEDFTADEDGCTQMHADSMRLNELSGHVIGGVLAVALCFWGSAGAG